MCDPLVEAMAAGLTAEVAAASGIWLRRCSTEAAPRVSAGHFGNPGQLWWEERATAMAIGGAGNTQIVLLGATELVRQLLEGSQVMYC
jgi:hypothetical protein